MLLRKSRRARLLFLLLFLCASAHAGKLLVSNATIGEKIYVLYEGEMLQNESVFVKPPHGTGVGIALWGNAAEFNASEEGTWKIVFRGEEYAALVFGGKGEEIAPVKNQWQGGIVPLLFMLLVFACVFAFAAAVWKNAGKTEMEFYAENNRLVLRSVHALEEPAISDADGKMLWAAKEFDRAGKLEISLLEMKTPFCLRARMHGGDICMWTDGRMGERAPAAKMRAAEKEGRDAGAIEGAKNAGEAKKKLNRAEPGFTS
ncbi:Uncharacterised protein [Candidatus Anstonella stagnisolia]|nr:Uncharacterised protein [Candidatus Anstonella stagnisolia]